MSCSAGIAFRTTRAPRWPRWSRGRRTRGRSSGTSFHHQGDVDTASYAAVPHLVRIYQARREPDWNDYGLVGTIELARGGRNPELPSWLDPAYSSALRSLAETGSRELWQSEERELAQCALALIALVRGHRRAGQLLLAYTEDELAEVLPE